MKFDVDNWIFFILEYPYKEVGNMSRSNIEIPTDMLQIYFLDDSPCYDINVKADSLKGAAK